MFKSLLAFALLFACTPMTAMAQHHHHHHGWHYHHHVTPRPIYVAPRPYYAPRPIYVAPRPYYGPSLYLNFGPAYPSYSPYGYGYGYSY